MSVGSSPGARCWTTHGARIERTPGTTWKCTSAGFARKLRVMLTGPLAFGRSVGLAIFSISRRATRSGMARSEPQPASPRRVNLGLAAACHQAGWSRAHSRAVIGGDELQAPIVGLGRLIQLVDVREALIGPGHGAGRVQAEERVAVAVLSDIGQGGHEGIEGRIGETFRDRGVDSLGQRGAA